MWMKRPHLVVEVLQQANSLVIFTLFHFTLLFLKSETDPSDTLRTKWTSGIQDFLLVYYISL